MYLTQRLMMTDIKDHLKDRAETKTKEGKNLSYACPNCSWGGDTPIKMKYYIESTYEFGYSYFCPECGLEVEPSLES
jgi:hypothetical protein